MVRSPVPGPSAFCFPFSYLRILESSSGWNEAVNHAPLVPSGLVLLSPPPSCPLMLLRYHVIPQKNSTYQ